MEHMEHVAHMLLLLQGDFLLVPPQKVLVVEGGKIPTKK